MSDEPKIVQCIRAGGKLIHEAPAGAHVAFIPGGKGAAAVIGPDFEPYIVYPDGRTERVEFRADVPDDEAVPQPGHGFGGPGGEGGY